MLQQISDYKFANLGRGLLERLKQLETELSQELHEPIVLLAVQENAQSNGIAERRRGSVV